MQPISFYSKKQNEVSKWVNQLGIRSKLEEDYQQYRVDLALNDLKLAIEIDGPSHKKVKKEGNLVTSLTNNISKRDKLLLECYPNGIYHIAVDMEEEDFKREFMKIIEMLK